MSVFKEMHPDLSSVSPTEKRREINQINIGSSQIINQTFNQKKRKDYQSNQVMNIPSSASLNLLLKRSYTKETHSKGTSDMRILKFSKIIFKYKNILLQNFDTILR